MKKRHFLLIVSHFIGFTLVFSQDVDGPNSKHERWEYVLEDTGDVLQLALPIAAGIMTLTKKDYQGTKKLALSYGTTLAVTYSLKYLTR